MFCYSFLVKSSKYKSCHLEWRFSQKRLCIMEIFIVSKTHPLGNSLAVLFTYRNGGLVIEVLIIHIAKFIYLFGALHYTQKIFH